MGLMRAAVVAAGLAGGTAAAQPPIELPPPPVITSVLEMDGAYTASTLGIDRPKLGIDKASLSWVMSDFYPPASLKAREEGVTVVVSCVNERGKVVKTAVRVSSGFPRLDQAALIMMSAVPMRPATLNGKAVLFCGYALSVDWKMPGPAGPPDVTPPPKP